MATTNFAAPYVLANQNQKHVTVNDQADVWDLFLGGVLESITTTAQPTSTVLGQAWYVPAGATGTSWSINTDTIARYDNGWKFYAVPSFFPFYVEDQGAKRTYYNGNWYWENLHASGSSSGKQIKEIVASVSGALVTLSAAIPANSIVSAISLLVSDAIVGPTSFSVGISGETDKFGSSIGVVLNSRNHGIIVPTAFYTDTNLLLTPAGGSFSSGEVELFIHMERFTLPDVL